MTDGAVSGTDGQRQKQADRQRQTQTQTDRQKDRLTVQTDRSALGVWGFQVNVRQMVPSAGQRHRQTGRDRHTESDTDTESDTGRKTDRQTDRQKNRQTDRHTHGTNRQKRASCAGFSRLTFGRWCRQRDRKSTALGAGRSLVNRGHTLRCGKLCMP